MMPGHQKAGARSVVPPFSPVLLLGLALKPVGPTLVQPVFDAMLRLVRRRHPDILERMAPFAHSAVCIDPVDLPFLLLLEPDPAAPRLTVRREIDPSEVAATVRGPLRTLIALAEGKVDGDALFFSRQLVVEGDTEVVVALRNAIDGAGIDLVEDIASWFGPLSRTAGLALRAAFDLMDKIEDNAETLRQALISPAVRDVDAQAARLSELEAEIKALRKTARATGRGAVRGQPA